MLENTIVVVVSTDVHCLMMKCRVFLSFIFNQSDLLELRQHAGMITFSFLHREKDQAHGRS